MALGQYKMNYIEPVAEASLQTIKPAQLNRFRPNEAGPRQVFKVLANICRETGVPV